MKGMVIQFRRGRHRYKPRHFLLEVEGVDSRDKAKKLLNMDVEWKSPGKKKKIIKGKITAAHGNKGVVRAIFEKGLPGQAIATSVEIKGNVSKKQEDKGKKDSEDKQ